MQIHGLQDQLTETLGESGLTVRDLGDFYLGAEVHRLCG